METVFVSRGPRRQYTWEQAVEEGTVRNLSWVKHELRLNDRLLARVTEWSDGQVDIHIYDREGHLKGGTQVWDPNDDVDDIEVRVAAEASA